MMFKTNEIVTLVITVIILIISFSVIGFIVGYSFYSNKVLEQNKENNRKLFIAVYFNPVINNYDIETIEAQDYKEFKSLINKLFKIKFKEYTYRPNIKCVYNLDELSFLTKNKIDKIYKNCL